MLHDGSAPQLPGVKRVVAVGSGKGGVGKSTIAWHLAQALSHVGMHVGLLDADVYGPSLPRFLGEHHHPDVVDGKLIPLRSDGLACMSIGFLVPPDKAAVWRGPMLMTAVKQMLNDVLWNVDGTLDCLIVDLPPGTGDVPLTLVQKVRVDGALIVITSHPLAVDDAIRAEAMFERLNVPLIGVVENMATISCASCGHVNAMFEPGHQPFKDKTIGSLPFMPPYTAFDTWQLHTTPIAQRIMKHLW